MGAVAGQNETRSGIGHTTHFINGEWSKAGGRTFPDYNPYNGELVAEIAAGGRAESEAAVVAAHAAFPAWAAMLPAERQRLFFKAADITERRLDDINAQLDVPITVNINGCPNSCARIQIADIGFKGQMVDDSHGGSVEGFQVHLGGSLGLDSGFGRKLRQHKVTSDELGDYIDRVVRNFIKQRDGGERFATWALRAEEGDLR